MTQTPPLLSRLIQGYLDQTGIEERPYHQMDHGVQDPECDHCKRALGPLYHHKVKGNRHLPVCTFDFSGPHPHRVNVAQYLLVCVSSLGHMRLIWAFGVESRQVSVVLPCLQSSFEDLCRQSSELICPTRSATDSWLWLWPSRKWTGRTVDRYNQGKSHSSTCRCSSSTGLLVSNRIFPETLTWNALSGTPFPNPRFWGSWGQCRENTGQFSETEVLPCLLSRKISGSFCEFTWGFGIAIFFANFCGLRFPWNWGSPRSVHLKPVPWTLGRQCPTTCPHLLCGLFFERHHYWHYNLLCDFRTKQGVVNSPWFSRASHPEFRQVPLYREPARESAIRWSGLPGQAPK